MMLFTVGPIFFVGNHVSLSFFAIFFNFEIQLIKINKTYEL